MISLPAKEESDENQREGKVNLAQIVVHHSAKHLGEPEVNGGEDSEKARRGHREVKVTYHPHGVVKINIRRDGSQNNPGQPTNTKNKDRPQGEEHRAGEVHGTFPHGVEPVQEENLSRDTDHKG